MGLSGGEDAARSATAMIMATAPQSGALISLPLGNEQRGKPEVRDRQRQVFALPVVGIRGFKDLLPFQGLHAWRSEQACIRRGC